MFVRKGGFSTSGRAAALATIATLALTAVEPSMAFAGGAPHGKGTSVTNTTTDISARRRHYHYHRGGGGAAAAAAFAGIVGTGLAIAAAQNRRDYYYDGYYGRPAYYGPGYYGGPAYYGGYRPYGYGW
jgi:hypothetical protein